MVSVAAPVSADTNTQSPSVSFYYSTEKPTDVSTPEKVVGRAQAFETTTVPYNGPAKVVAIKQGENPQDVLRSDTKSPMPNQSASRDLRNFTVMADYPDCGFFTSYPCMRHGETQITWVGSPRDNFFALGPFNYVDPCYAPSGCDVSSTASGSFSGSFSVGLEIGGDKVKASTGLNFSASYEFSATVGIKVELNDSGGIRPDGNRVSKDFGLSQTNWLCTFDYSYHEETCSLYSTTYSSGTAYELQNSIRWYNWYVNR